MANRKHGGCENYKTTPEYRSWRAMINRCCDPNSQNFKNYGARGISVCSRWRTSFSAFLADLGRRPTLDHRLERIDNDGNYEPSNCRWATVTEQRQNTRTNRQITINGESRCVAEWARRLGISPFTIHSRLRRGLTGDQAIYGDGKRSGRQRKQVLE